MKQLLLSMCILAVMNAFAAEMRAFRLPGYWAGGFSRDGSIERLEVEFRYDGDRLQGRYDIPELGMYSQPLDSLSWQVPNLSFKCIHGYFNCIVDTAYGEITAINEKWQPPVRLHLRRVETPPQSTRAHEVSFQSGDVKLAGTVYEPAALGKHPGVVIMHGGSDTTRHVWTYRSLGEIFARHGYVALVYDKRGFGQSTGNRDPSLKEQAQDGIAAMKFLGAQKSVDAKKVGLKVASQSGWCAPLIAKTYKPAFMILASTPSVSVAAQERQRVEYSMRQEGIAEDSIREAVAYVDLFFDVLNDRKPWEDLKTQTDKVKVHEWSQYLGLAEKPEDLDWFRENAYDPSPDLPNLTMPVLALYGENDPLVPPKLNADLLESRIRAAGNTRVKVVVFPRGSHLIEDWNTLRNNEWKWPTGYWHWDRRAPGYFEEIFEWLDQTVEETPN